MAHEKQCTGRRAVLLAVLCSGLCVGACAETGSAGDSTEDTGVAGADSGVSSDADEDGGARPPVPASRTSQLCSAAGMSENDDYTLIQCTGPAGLQGPELEGEKYRLQLRSPRPGSN